MLEYVLCMLVLTAANCEMNIDVVITAHSLQL